MQGHGNKQIYDSCLREGSEAISLTYVPYKVMKSVVNDYIIDHMELNNCFSENQHGFRKEYSCVTQLLKIQWQLR